jgi:hypothetical protein
MDKKHTSMLNLNSGFVLILLMSLNLVFSSNTSAQRSLIKIKCFKDTYLIKASETAVKISFKDLNGLSRDFIDSANKQGLYLRKLGMIEYNSISYLEFKPYWKSVRIINALYFASMVNLFPLAIYESYTNLQGSGFGVLMWFVSIPIWAGIVPGTYNLLLYEQKPIIVLDKVDESNFEMIKERY